MRKSVQIVCAGVAACAAFLAQGGTVAYWPMELNPATGGTARTIADVSGNGYDLRSELTDAQARTSTDIPFAAPPNGPADVTAASCAEIVDGTKLAVNAFSRGTASQTQTSDPLVLAMGLRRSFTLEGYMYVKSLKHGDGADTIIAFSGVNGNSDWIWNLTEPEKDSNTRNVVVIIRGGDGLSGNGVVATIDDAEIVGGWHHYALVYKFNADGNRSLWTFYLDGVNRGSQTMPNHATATQHDRFVLGGVNSGAHKTFDAKLAFWRVSDEALDSNALLCHRTFGTTVAYWPMEVISGFYHDALRSIVPDPVDARNSLMVRDSDQGGVSCSASDIGWTLPPNPDADFTAAGIRAPSPMMVHSGNNTTKIEGQYREVFSVVSNAPVIAATKLTESFTIEGYLKFATLPADSTKNQTFAYNTLGETGGWIWNLYGADSNGNLAVKLSYKTSNNRPAVTLGDRFRPEELLNVWNHYALTFTPDNGRGQTEWRFYLNGRLRGKSNAMAAYASHTFNKPLFFISGARSGGNPQALLGDMTCWRVSSKALKPSELLCGGEEPSVPADAFVWTGSASSGEWSTGSVANWTADGEPTAWTDAKDAYFDDSHVADTINVVGEVKPTSINVQADTNMKVVFKDDGSSSIGVDCTNIVKRGFGTFELFYGGNTPVNLMKANCPIEVREGCLRVTAINSNGGLGDASKGYEVKIFDHATLSLNGRNAIGSATPTVANDSVFTVYTNGTFDIFCGAKEMGVQALGMLDLLGGNFGAPDWCHGLGYLLVRDRLTLGLRPDRRPYVFPAVVDNGGKNVSGGITIGRNTEFRVEDITGDGASDGIFNCAVLARTRDGWQTEQTPCGFRKTGAGTMELNGTYSGSGDQARPSGVIAVEAGELKINIDYRGPSKYAVAAGAFLSGTGTVSTVEFAAGAGLRVDAGKGDLLELAGADFAGAGVIELSGVSATAAENLKVDCAKITGAATGTANLANWTVKVDGEVVPLAMARISNGILKAAVVKGTMILVR